MNKPEIIYKDENIVVVNKPHGMPSQEDKTGDKSVLLHLADMLSSEGECADVYPVHRLDRGVGGLMVVARSKRAATELTKLIQQRTLHKEYLAVVFGACEGGSYSDYLYKDSVTNKSYVVKTKRAGSKPALLNAYRLASSMLESRDVTLLRIELHTGRHHQIRAQLSSRGYPLLGDKKYGGACVCLRSVALFSRRLRFFAFGREFDFSLLPRLDSLPFSLFEKELSTYE